MSSLLYMHLRLFCTQLDICVSVPLFTKSSLKGSSVLHSLDLNPSPFSLTVIRSASHESGFSTRQIYSKRLLKAVVHRCSIFPLGKKKKKH